MMGEMDAKIACIKLGRDGLVMVGAGEMVFFSHKQWFVTKLYRTYVKKMSFRDTWTKSESTNHVHSKVSTTEMK
jgi:hypothetical protein